MNTRVEDKSGEELVNIISENVGRMLRRKMDAVTCIRIAAEEAAERWNSSGLDAAYKTGSYDEKIGNFSYISSKNSPVISNDSATKKRDSDGDNGPKDEGDEEDDAKMNNTKRSVYR